MTRISIILASLGRREVLATLVEKLSCQTRRADPICIVVPGPDDAPPPQSLFGASVLYSPPGLCAQRNTGIDRVKPVSDIIVFFDDDFVPADDYLERLEDLFKRNPLIAGATGRVLRDGVTGPGLTFEEAESAIALDCMAPEAPETIEQRISLYGCNMAFRTSAIGDERFDERLPLYGWLEDVDFSTRAMKSGPLIRSSRLVGVHLGVKRGRTSGIRFGYSQIMNPVYLRKKRTIGLHHAFDNLYRNILSNHVRVFAPEPYVDRWGRVKGNWIAFFDLARGRITPERIVEF